MIPWWTILLIPVAAFAGFVLCAILASGRYSDSPDEEAEMLARCEAAKAPEGDHNVKASA